MKAQEELLESILADAVEIQAEAERREFVDQACAGDEELKRRVQELVENHFRAGGFLESPVPNLLDDEGVEAWGSNETVAEGPGAVIGPYKLVEQIGEGGFGVVFMAEQQRPVRRKVALKVVKPGMDTRQVVARFEAERQALALMDHPGIAQVFDGGETPSGRPYFVMELVRGVPITDFCDDNQLSVRERLELFATVCEAVQHAHQKGVIHRDLKPSNVLVTIDDAGMNPSSFPLSPRSEGRGAMLHSRLSPRGEGRRERGEGRVKVIDFGIAKATGQQLTDKTLSTNVAQMLGTPMYMSPEQAQMSPGAMRDIDTRTDIYSLGVLLYELLTGTTPFDKERLRSATFDEIRRIIREEDPPKPSTRLTELGSRQTPRCESQSFNPQPQARGSSAAEPMPHKDLAYGCGLNQHGRNVSSGAGGSGAMADGTRSVPATSTLASISANRRSDLRRLSQLFRGELDWVVMKALDKDRNRRYESASAFAADVSRYLYDEPVLAYPPTLGYQVRKFVRRHRGPVVAITVVLLALVGGVVGTTWGMIRAQRAEQAEARRADAETNERRRANAAEGEAKRLEKEAKDSLQRANAIVEFLRYDLLGVAGSIGQASRQFPPNPNLTVREALDRAAGSVGDKFKDQPELEAGIRETVGAAYRQLGQYDKAIAQLELSADLRAQRLGADHLVTLDARHHLALAYGDAGMTTEAIELYEQVRDAQVRLLGADNSRTLTTLNNLAGAYRAAGRLPAARALFEQVRLARMTTLGPDDPATLVTLHNIATMDLFEGKTTEAIAQFEQILDAKIKVLGSDHLDILPSLHNLATAYWKSKQLDRSIPLFEKLVPLHVQILGQTHPTTLGAMANLGVNYRDAGRLADAIALLEQVHRDAEKYESLRWVDWELYIAYARAEKYAEAVPLLLARVAADRKAVPVDTAQLAGVLANHAEALLKLNAWAESEPILRECLAIRQKLEPNEWRTFHTESMLGEALMGQKKHADAEPLLLEAYEGMAEREATVPSNAKVRLPQALKRIVKLYDTWGKPEKAAEWQNKLDAR